MWLFEVPSTPGKIATSVLFAMRRPCDISGTALLIEGINYSYNFSVTGKTTYAIFRPSEKQKIEHWSIVIGKAQFCWGLIKIAPTVEKPYPQLCHPICEVKRSFKEWVIWETVRHLDVLNPHVQTRERNATVSRLVFDVWRGWGRNSQLPCVKSSLVSWYTENFMIANYCRHKWTRLLRQNEN